MPITELFPNPTVKSVFFEVRYPTLFYMETKIGDLQLKVIERFPESSLVFQRQFLLADLGPDAGPGAIPSSNEAGTTPIWQFKSPAGFLFNVRMNSLWIHSQVHKTYNLPGAEKFRDVMDYVIGAFLSVTKVPLFTRIGLRYLDECPIPEKANEAFAAYYNTALPLHRFNLADAREMACQTVVAKGDCFLRYAEKLVVSNDGKSHLVLDFDGYRERINSADWLAVSDQLHDLISTEFERSIKQPVYEHMKRKKEEPK